MDKILIVEDSEEIRKQLKWGLGKEYEVLLAENGREAVVLFRKHRPKVVTLDLGLTPHVDSVEEGFRCLEETLSIAPATKVIVITGNEDRSSALRAVQSGACDFYQKPIDINELKIVIKRAFHIRDIEDENYRLQSVLGQKNKQFGGMVGQCPQMEHVFSTIRKVAPSDVSIFITGESGTGKELVARAIHNLSLRKEQRFVPINCGAIPENLLESELFGHEKGAFTGAHSRVQGKVEYAHGGTLFLDEIGEIPPNLQVKLLRFLQEKVIQRVGGRDDITVNTRVISATNIDIKKAIDEGTFREDLYYRIAVVNIDIPPLRERGSDIMLLANLFLRGFAASLGRKVKGFSADAVERLRSYEWPGNVRELENMVQRAVIMSDSPIVEAAALGFGGETPSFKMLLKEKMTLKDARERVERDLIVAVVREQGGNIAKTAERLGVSRPTLYDLMRKHGIEP
jgi:two-component system NtrC family response regulator